MTDGGAIVNEVSVRVDGEEAKVLVVVSHDSVEIGDRMVFRRQDLLFALGVPAGPSP